MIPEKRNAIGPIRTRKRAFEAFNVIHIGRDHFRPQPSQCFRFIGVTISGNRPRREAAIWVIQNGTN